MNLKNKKLRKLLKFSIFSLMFILFFLPNFFSIYHYTIFKQMFKKEITITVYL